MGLLETTTLDLIAAGALMFVGVAAILYSLRVSLRKSRDGRAELARREEVERKYWRTMDAAIDSLGEITGGIHTRIEDRNASLDKLTQEAAAAAERLAALLARAKEHETAAAPPARATPDEGKVVNFRIAASAALVKKNHRRVYDGFDRGESIQDISRDTGLQVGEIELILALRDKIDGKSSAG